MQTDDHQTAAAEPPASRVDDAAPQGGTAAALPYTCKWGSGCAVYNAIGVEAADANGVHRITFRGTFIARLAPFDAAVMVMGLHAGAHLEANEWRWNPTE